MEKTFEEKPLYRLFNVILFIFYFITTLLTIGTGLLAYSSRPVANASVSCKDGTHWNATKIYWNNEALCGICTQRSADSNKYTECSYQNMDYSSYTVTKTYGWTWWIVLAPLLVFIIGFGTIDFLKLTIVYIFSGKIAFEKSLLLRLLVLLFSSNNHK